MYFLIALLNSDPIFKRVGLSGKTAPMSLNRMRFPVEPVVPFRTETTAMPIHSGAPIPVIAPFAGA